MRETESIVDVYLTREWDGAEVLVIVGNGDDSEVDNLLHQGYKVTKTVTIL